MPAIPIRRRWQYRDRSRRSARTATARCVASLPVHAQGLPQGDAGKPAVAHGTESRVLGPLPRMPGGGCVPRRSVGTASRGVDPRRGGRMQSCLGASQDRATGDGTHPAMNDHATYTTAATQHASDRMRPATTVAQKSRSRSFAAMKASRRLTHHGHICTGPGVSIPCRSQKPPHVWQRPLGVRLVMMNRVRSSIRGVYHDGR